MRISLTNFHQIEQIKSYSTSLDLPRISEKVTRTICWIRPLDWFYFISNITLEEQAKDGIKFVDFARIAHVL